MKATLTVELVNPWSNKLLWKGEQAVPVVKQEKVEDAAIDAVVALAKQVPRPQGTPVPAPTPRRHHRGRLTAAATGLSRGR
jgi:hypothetical protein